MGYTLFTLIDITMDKPNIALTEEYTSYTAGTKIIAKHYDHEAQKLRAIIIKNERYEMVTFTLHVDEIAIKRIWRGDTCHDVRKFIKHKKHWHEMTLHTTIGGRTGEMVA
jgi:hypothetical protein